MGIYLNGVDLYPVEVSRDGDRFIACFVDIPGCQGSGKSLTEAEDNAGRALAAREPGRDMAGGCAPFGSLQRQLQQRTGRYLSYIKPLGRRR